jgi:hypothetical protein
MLSCFRCSVALALAFGPTTNLSLTAQTPKISKKEAQGIALKLHPGRVKSSELETEKGIRIYSFDIQTKAGIREVGVDANTGKVVEDSAESASDEKKEKAAPSKGKQP